MSDPDAAFVTLPMPTRAPIGPSDFLVRAAEASLAARRSLEGFLSIRQAMDE